MRSTAAIRNSIVCLLLLTYRLGKTLAFQCAQTESCPKETSFRGFIGNPTLRTLKSVQLMTTNSEIGTTTSLPEKSTNGVYQIQTEEHYNALLAANPDKLVVVKYFASYCRACKTLAPKFIEVVRDPQLAGLPIVWAEYMASRTQREVFKKLSVLTLPTVHFYDGSRGLVDNFPCGPSKVPILKKKLSKFVNSRVDPATRQLKGVVVETTPEPRVERAVVDNELITADHIIYLRTGMSFFQDLSEYEFYSMLKKAKLQTFNAGDVIIRQGMPPKHFYVIKTGRVEMGIRSKFDDPISTPHDYLGAIVNELGKFDYFGERALSTGEPYAASFRVVDKARCFVFDVDDIPESSVLSKKRRATSELVDQLSQRYELPDDYKPTYPVTPKDESILELLVKFKQIRQVAKCFEYVVKSEPNWGNVGEIARRSMLVSKLSKAQRDEFLEVFNLIDIYERGRISLMDLKKFMWSARGGASNRDILQVMTRINPVFPYDYSITRDEFMGVIAEAEFYNLFTETFQELDPENTGYVRAGDLDDMLGSVRDLISDDTTSIIDVEDKDMLVDYEQFSKMILGAAL